MIADINPGGGASSPDWLTRTGDRVVFSACDAGAGCEPWEVRGTEVRRLDDLVPGSGSSNPGPFAAAGGRVFFDAAAPQVGIELFAFEACTGDCDASATVSIDELVRAVRVALGTSPRAACAAADRNGNGQVTIDELVAAVNTALNGCTTTPPP
jgi:ELWxxDGT repeat protein